MRVGRNGDGGRICKGARLGLDGWGTLCGSSGNGSANTATAVDEAVLDLDPAGVVNVEVGTETGDSVTVGEIIVSLELA